MTENTYEKIIKLLEEKNYEEIIKICSEILKTNEDGKAYFYRGLSKHYLERYKEAIKDYNKSIKLKYNNAMSYNNRAISKIKLGKYKEATKDYDEVIKLNPNNENSYLQRGNCKEYVKEYKEAIEDYNKVIKLNPNNKNIYGNRGNCKYNLQQYEEAIKDYDEFIKLCPNRKKLYIAYINRGNCKYNLQQYEEAIKDYDEVIKLNPDNKYNESVYFYRGASKDYLEKYKEAMEDYNKVIKLNDKHEGAYNNRGFLKVKSSQYKEAMKDYNKAIASNSECLQSYYNRYLLKNYFNRYKSAIEDFYKYIELTKKHDFKISIIINTFCENIKVSNIKFIFNKLIEKDYNNLWESDSIFYLLKHRYKIKNKNMLYNIKNILLYQYLLLKSLSFINIDYSYKHNTKTSHYTSLNTLLLLLNDKKEYKKEKDKNEKGNKDNKEDEGKIRIVNISNANDPKEGKILESIFNKNGLDIKLKNNENLITLQTSFSRNKDSLTMFRLYGKNENKEATGICLVIDKEYFNNNTYQFSPPIQITNNILEDNKNLDNDKNEEQVDNTKKNLFWILYYNEKENKLIFNPKYSKYENIIINLDNIEELKSKYDTKKCKTTLNDKKEIIEYIFSNIYYYTKELDKKIKDRELKNEIFSNIFENIKYLIKDEAFFEEQELRMLITTNYEDKLIEMDNNNKRLYINYIKLFDKNNNYINEIILGPKIENSESMVEYIKKVLSNKYSKEGIKKKDIKVSISKAPLR